MLRFYYLILRNIFILPGIIGEMRRKAADETCSEEECYAYLQYVVDIMEKTGRIRTEVFGTENLPAEGGYIMYPNHQGKYDAYGIVSVHEKPCTVVMDEAKSHTIFVREIIDMMKGKRLDKQDVKQSFGIIQQIAQEVSQGRRYIIFPEGGYDADKKNSLIDFKAGCFKASMKSKTPIVPVVLVDSYKVMGVNSLREVTMQVHYLKPICYEEYAGMKTQQIANLVRERIQEKLDEIADIE